MIFTLLLSNNQEIQIAINKNKFYVIYKKDEDSLEQEFQTNIDLS